MSVSDYGETQMLGLIPEKPYVKLHTGDPGEAGTANAAAETSRKQVTLGAASGGERKNTTEPQFTNVAATETYTHFSLWDSAGPAGGNCWGSGALAEAKSVTVGESIAFAVGDLAYKLD